MTRKLNQPAILAYSQRYAGKLCDEFFTRIPSINGQQILNLSNIGQINTFVVESLYEKWKADTESFKSSYFDFENEAVSQALQSFMNTVSQHIKVSREDFEPLLANATERTIGLLIEPKLYIENILREMPDFQVQSSDLKKMLKYTRLNRALLQKLDEKMADEDSVYVSQAINWLDEVSGPMTFEDPDKYIELLSAKVPVSLDDFYRKNYEETPIVEAMPPVFEEPKASTSFFDMDMHDDEAAPLPTLESLRSSQHIEQIVRRPEPETTTINERLYQDLPTVNDILSRESNNATWADTQSRTAIKSIAEGISLNQKFTFIGKLFDGDIHSYHAALAELDQCLTFGDAKNIMNRKLAPKFNWIMAAEEADEFLEIVSRKFV
jgi:hypothetical protein